MAGENLNAVAISNIERLTTSFAEAIRISEIIDKLIVQNECQKQLLWHNPSFSMIPFCIYINSAAFFFSYQ